jgi:hypothetical protein
MNIAAMLLMDFVRDEHVDEYIPDDIDAQWEQWIDEQDAPLSDVYVPPVIDMSDLPW